MNQHKKIIPILIILLTPIKETETSILFQLINNSFQKDLTMSNMKDLLDKMKNFKVKSLFKLLIFSMKKYTHSGNKLLKKYKLKK
jgi:hypothetical protein